jgi:hypothetical protein
MKKVIHLLSILFALTVMFVACEKIPEKPPIDSVENPLTDLPWLKAKIDEFNLLFQENPDLSVAIYQCKYGNNETGFLIDEGNMKPFYNWNGEVLCIMGRVAGETCSELHIVSKKLIWKMEKKPQELCHCIMDTLKGEWSWVKKHGGLGGNTIDNDFKSIVKILNQNEDASINYEVIVDDTLFHKGSFQFQHPLWAQENIRVINIKLPHRNSTDNWIILFEDLSAENPSENTLRFCQPAADGYNYIYKKIK